MPICESQKLWLTFHRGAGGVLEGRQALQESIAQMQAIARRTGLEEVLEGCLGGFPIGSSPQPVEVARAPQPARTSPTVRNTPADELGSNKVTNVRAEEHTSEKSRMRIA